MKLTAGSALLVLLACMGLAPILGSTFDRREHPVVTHGPMLGRLTSSSIGVWVRTSRPCPIRVQFGVEPDRLSHHSAIGRTLLEHDNTGWVELTNLQPDTLYHYRVTLPQGDRPAAELAGSFRTLPQPAAAPDNAHNPRGLFNFRFAVGACNSQKQGTAVELPAFRRMLDRHRGELAFAIQNGDWLYEEERALPVATWIERHQPDSAKVPNVVRAAPVIVGAWENYKIYLERSANLREWHRNVPTFSMFDDHELLGDVTGIGNIGLRDRRAAFRDIGIQAWSDYLGWSNPRWHEDKIIFGEAQLEAGSDLLRASSTSLAGLDPAKAGSLMVLWNDETAGVNEDIYDTKGGDPNAGVYAIREVVDATTLRISPAARATGKVSFSIGRPQYTSFRVGNCEFFLLDTRSYRQLHDRKNPFDPKVAFLGEQQKKWLKDRMSRSDAEFLFVVSTVAVMLPHLEPRAKTPEGANENDSWSAAGAERKEMIDFWNSLDRPVLLLTGDLHNSYAMQLGPRLWEFLAAPQNSGSAFSTDAGNPPPSGRFEWLGQTADIRWSTFVPEDTPPPRYDPVYSIVQVNNVFESPGPTGGRRLIAYPRPQVVVQYYRALTGELLYAESVVAADRKQR